MPEFRGLPDPDAIASWQAAVQQDERAAEAARQTRRPAMGTVDWLLIPIAGDQITITLCFPEPLEPDDRARLRAMLDEPGSPVSQVLITLAEILGPHARFRS